MSRFVVIDLEMCNVPKGAHKHLRNELIQIGAVLLDEDMKPEDSFMTYVRPAFGFIDNRIKKLTGISNENVKNAPDAKKALEMFIDWIPEDAIPVSWSDNDEHQIRTEMHYKGIEIPRFSELFSVWTDCQKTFAQKIGVNRCYRLCDALAIAGVQCEDGFHDALQDAKNTAKLFRKMETETEFTLSVYYIREEQAEHLTYNPFKDLFSGYSFAG